MERRNVRSLQELAEARLSALSSERLLTTRRLQLEPLVPAHARHLFEPLRDTRLYQFHAGPPPASIEELEQRYAGWAKRQSPDGTQTWLNYAVREANGSYVGWVQATVASGVATIGYDIFPDFWRRGYATEACSALIRMLAEEYDVTSIIAVVDAENIASIRLLERLAFSCVWTGPSEDMPGRVDRRYEKRRSTSDTPLPN